MAKRFRILRRAAIVLSWVILLLGAVAAVAAWHWVPARASVDWALETRQHDGARLLVDLSGISASHEGLVFAHVSATVEDASALPGTDAQNDGRSMMVARNGAMPSLIAKIEGYIHRSVAPPGRWKPQVSSQGNQLVFMGVGQHLSSARWLDARTGAPTCSMAFNLWSAPWWWLAAAWALASLPAAIHLIGRLAAIATSAKGRRRLVRGLCPTCGYDLRATPGRCPECGSAVPTGVATTPYPPLRINAEIVAAVVMALTLLRLPGAVACLRCIAGTSSNYALPRFWAWTQPLADWLMVAALAALGLILVRYACGCLNHLRSALPAPRPPMGT